MHASKWFLQVLLVGIQMTTYLVDAYLPKLELFARKGSKNSGISLVLIHIKIGSELKLGRKTSQEAKCVRE